MRVELSAGLLPIPIAEGLNMCKDLNIFLKVFSCDTQWVSRWTKNMTISENIMLTGDVSITFFLKHPPYIRGKISCSKACPNYTTKFQGALYMHYVHVLSNDIYLFTGRPCSCAIHKMDCLPTRSFREA